MINKMPLRYRYAQFFVLFMLCSLFYLMAQNIRSGTISFQNDFYKKDFLIEKVNLLRIKIGDRVFPAALLGKDGWMEFTSEGNIDDFQNVKKIKNKKNFGKELTVLDQYLKSQGITLIIVVAPNKATIYPDKLPEQIKSLPTPSRLDDFISYLNNNNLPLVVDLRPALQAARQNQDVYYKTDTHWNGYGAFVAYRVIVKSLENSYPELKPYASTDLKLVTTNAFVHDIPKLMQINSILEPSLFFTPKKPFVQTSYLDEYIGYNQFSQIQGSHLPTLLMFHDSFGPNYLNNYLSMNFGKSHFVQVRSMSKYLTQASIRQFKPDVIIIEIVERNLHLLPDYFPDFMFK